MAKVGTSNPDRTISLKRLQCAVENKHNAAAGRHTADTDPTVSRTVRTLLSLTQQLVSVEQIVHPNVCAFHFENHVVNGWHQVHFFVVHLLELEFRDVLGIQVIWNQTSRLKADLHIACRAHDVPLHSTAVSRRPCCAVALRRTAWSKHGMGAAWQV